MSKYRRGCSCDPSGSVLCHQCRAYLARACPDVTQTMLPEPESSFQARVRRAAIDLGYAFYHTHDSRGSDPDFPDCVIVRPGRCFVWELKVNRNKPTQGQLNWISLLNTVTGIQAAVYYPKDWESMLEQLARKD